MKQSWGNDIPTIESNKISLPDALCLKADQVDMDLKRSVIGSPNEQNGIEEAKPILSLGLHQLATLSASPGFVYIKANQNLDDLTLRFIYALISRGLGVINNRYGYFFDVKDYGLDHTKLAIPVSKTRAATGFHTDSTAVSYFPDVVGLLCLHQSEYGGESVISNAANLYSIIETSHPEHLPVLTQSVPRDVITPGTQQNREAILNNQFPVFNKDGENITFRYMRYWIETGFAKNRYPYAGSTSNCDGFNRQLLRGR